MKWSHLQRDLRTGEQTSRQGKIPVVKKLGHRSQVICGWQHLDGPRAVCRPVVLKHPARCASLWRASTRAIFPQSSQEPDAKVWIRSLTCKNELLEFNSHPLEEAYPQGLGLNPTFLPFFSRRTELLQLAYRVVILYRK